MEQEQPFSAPSLADKADLIQKHVVAQVSVVAAQVKWFDGAGVEKGLVPAPLKRVKRYFAAPVPRLKSHRRQEWATPAPVKAFTCTKSPIFGRVSTL